MTSSKELLAAPSSCKEQLVAPSYFKEELVPPSYLRAAQPAEEEPGLCPGDGKPARASSKAVPNRDGAS